ncbi:MAG: GNAT family N-acetyltransferase [Armatimonadota bacterium]
MLILLSSSEDIAHLERHSAIPPLDDAAFRRRRPDAQWALVEGERLLGRVSLWWTKTPAYGEHRIGLIGHYAAADQAASDQLLDHACAELAARGCTLAVGPMDGNTLQRYRFIVERGEEPPFLLEPDNPDEWPGYWQARGFTTLASYYSALNTDLSYEDPRIPRAAERLARNGVTIRPLHPDAFEEDLRRIYQVAAVGFRRNFLASPFTEEEFLDLYLPYRQYVQSEVVFIAEHDGRPVGFMFNIPDLLQAQRGEPVDTLILKTFAELPGRIFAGLGNVLLARSHRVARELGYRRGIHALMHEGNTSLIISNRFSRPFRRYALYAKELKP